MSRVVSLSALLLLLPACDIVDPNSRSVNGRWESTVVYYYGRFGFTYAEIKITADIEHAGEKVLVEGAMEDVQGGYRTPMSGEGTYEDGVLRFSIASSFPMIRIRAFGDRNKGQEQPEWGTKHVECRWSGDALSCNFSGRNVDFGLHRTH